jgi:CheY-like chemotaxis protein
VKKRRILVVDDHRDAALSMAAILKRRGHELAVAHDGESAIATAESFRPEVILMDVGMPGLNGYDATRRIRQQSWGKAIFVIALTGWGQETDRADSRAAGCDAHLVKPARVAAVEEVLQQIP